MARILVTDGEQRAALSVVRSLGRSGHEVVVVAGRARSLAAASRYGSRSVVAPDPLAGPDAFAQAVADASESCDVLIPVTEAAALALLGKREALPPIPLPDLESFRAIHDKVCVTDVARRAGIAVPEQIVLETSAASLPPAWGDRKAPVVVKPGRSVVTGRGGVGSKHGVGYAKDGPALRRSLAAMPASAFPMLLQEKIEGPGVGVFLLRWDGVTRAVFGHERIREKPPSGGVSVLRRSVEVTEDLLGRCSELLAAFDWQGVAMVELKIDARSGVPHVMEVNGRFWGSLQLAVDAGVDFPSLLVHYALGGAPLPVPAYQAGVTSRWLWGDVDHLLAVLRRRGLPPGAERQFSRARAVGRFLATFRPGVRMEVWDPRDPRPFVHETLDWLRGA